MKFQNKAAFGLALVTMFVLGGCTRNGIPLLGLDDNDKLVEINVSESEYKNQMGRLFTQVNSATLPALVEQDQPEFGLRTAVIGLGLKFEAGFGPFVKASAEPKFRMAFSNHKKPPIP